MTTIVSFISTHQARLRCFLNGYMTGKVLRFKNAAILQMIINREGTYIKLIYDGEVDKKENKSGYVYYVKELDKPVPVGSSYEHFTFNGIVNLDKKSPDGNIYIFYLMRHGQASHNLYSGIGKLQSLYHTDTDITDLGKEQASNAAKNILNDTTAGIITMPKYLFASDLKRTRETITIFLRTYFKTDFEKIPKTIVILQCAHELEYTSGNCDENQNIKSKAGENVMKCDKKTCQNIDEFNLNWDNYMRFYGNDYRNNILSSKNIIGNSSRGKCRETNMIDQAISYIKNNPIEEDEDPFGSGNRSSSFSSSFRGGVNRFYISYSPT